MPILMKTVLWKCRMFLGMRIVPPILLLAKRPQIPVMVVAEIPTVSRWAVAEFSAPAIVSAALAAKNP